MISFVLAIFAVSTLLSLLFTGGQWLYCLLVGIPVTKVQLFHGNTLVSWTRGSLTIGLGLIPTGSFLVYDVPAFRSRSLLVRWGISLLGPLVLLVVAAVLLGVHQSLHQVVSGMVQLLLGILEPHKTAWPCIARLHQIFGESLWQFVGILAAKLAAWNLLPLGVISGGRVLLEPFNPEPEGLNPAVAIYMTASALVAIGGMVVWGYVIARYALQGTL